MEEQPINAPIADTQPKTVREASEQLTDEEFDVLYRDFEEAMVQQFMDDEVLPVIDLAPFYGATDEQRRKVEECLVALFEAWDRQITYPPLVANCLLYTSEGERWMSFPLNVGNYKLLVEKLKRHTFLRSYDVADDWNSDDEEDIIPEWRLLKRLEISPIPQAPLTERRKKHRNGSFLPYTIGELLKGESEILNALGRIQLFTSIKEHKRELSESCWIYALIQYGIEEEVINRIKLRLNDRSQKAAEIVRLTESEIGKHIYINYMDDTAEKSHRRRNIGSGFTKKSESDFTINCYNDHYFLEFKCSFTKDYLKKTLAGEYRGFVNQRYDGHRWKNTTESKYYCSSSDLLQELLQTPNALIPLKFSDYLLIPNIDTPDIDDFSDLSYDSKTCISSYKKMEVKEMEYKYFFGDTEADTLGSIHRPYMFCIQSMVGERFTALGRYCIEQGLEHLPSNSVIYFHNLAYDSRFFVKYGADGQAIVKGSKVFQLTISYNCKKIILRDSLAITQAPLAKFPKMFHLVIKSKEIMPYDYYTIERLESGKLGNVDEAIKVGKLDESAAEQFKHNISMIDNCDRGDGRFDMWLYSEYYCQMDVSILREGFLKFRDLILNMEFDGVKLGLDIFNILTAPSLAHKFFSELVYSNAAIKSYSGVVDAFIRKAILGGRCMTAYNKLIKVESENYLDFDARSLYPSAMNRMAIPLGSPTVIEEKDLNLGFVLGCDMCVLEVEFQPVLRHRAFPLFALTDADGNNLYSDTFNHPITQYLSTVRFVDILVYYSDLCSMDKEPTTKDILDYYAAGKGIQYKIKRGYYWKGGRDTKIQSVISTVYSKRRECKKEVMEDGTVGNPLQEVYKLIMNSAYGKTIQKPIDTKIVYVSDSDKANYYRLNYNYIIEAEQVFNSKISKFTVRKAIDRDFHYSLIGVLVLDYSKRIMNEVMCLAEDIGCRILYQDTDSIHIRESDLPYLAEVFELKYGRKLIGEELGQFHSDFDDSALEWGLEPKSTVSRRSIFVAKKIYIDELVDKNGKVGYHYRMKGISQDSVKEKSKKYGGLWNLYCALATYEPITFELVVGNKKVFEFDKAGSGTITTRISFEREVEAKYETCSKSKTTYEQTYFDGLI